MMYTIRLPVNSLFLRENQINEEIARIIDDSPIEQMEIRSVLTCESRKGVCAKCYGRNLATSRMVQNGEAVGVIAAQSIGEPGTQLTLRTFHVGGTAMSITTESRIVAKYNGIAEIDELRVVECVEADGIKYDIVIGRLAELRVVDKKTGISLTTNNIPYGAKLHIKNGAEVNKGDLICEWDPYNAVIISEVPGKVSFESVIEGVTFKEESDEVTGYREKVIMETRDRTKNPGIEILDKNDNVLKTYNLPVGSHLSIEEGALVKAGDVLVKIPRAVGKSG